VKPSAPVLVIEDEPSVTAFIRRALERNGYSVVAARSGLDALRLLGAGSFTGIISDMRTPGGVTGADVHAWLAQHRPELATRVIFVTGDIANDETRRLLASTGAPCIEKPFRVQQLISAAGELFGMPQPAAGQMS
jgi:CheY-like chemotaxis protein